MTQKDGVIIIDKESGQSSFHAVKRARNILKAKTGHAGTLDPFANGLLILLINQGTKLSRFLMSQDKVYRAKIRFGIETDTQDLTGKIIQERDIKGLTEELVRKNILKFVGTIKQTPPLYSAVHYKGKRAYEHIRRGMPVDIKERDVKINYINMLSVNLPVIEVEVGCGPGTYIRTLASDLGKCINIGAHVTFLRRIRSGSFFINNAISLEELAKRKSDAAINEVLIPLKDALSGMAEVEISHVLAGKIRNGYRPTHKEFLEGRHLSYDSGDYLKAVVGEELIAVLRESDDRYDIVRVFN